MSTHSSEGSSSPVAPNAPKFGTLVPNRIFVGGISANTTEAELSSLFSQYGNVKATKIISDRAGVSKGYGFITFETEDEAKRIQTEADNIMLKDRKLNIAPAIKKQPFARVYADPAQSTQNGASVVYSNGVPYVYVYENGMAVYAAASSNSMYQVPQSQAAYSPLIYPQAIYIPQHYSYQASGHGLPSPSYMYASPAALSPTPSASSPSTNNNTTTTTTINTSLASISSPSVVPSGDAYAYPPPGMHHYAFSPPPTYFHPHLVEYPEPEISSEQVKPNNGRSKGSPYNSSNSSPNRGYNTGRPMRLGPNTLLPTPSGSGDPSRTIQQIQRQQPHLVAKQVNGVTVMAYSSPLVIGSAPTPPTTPHGRDCNQFDDASNMTHSTMTPPPTPMGNADNIYKA